MVSVQCYSDCTVLMSMLTTDLRLYSVVVIGTPLVRCTCSCSSRLIGKAGKAGLLLTNLQLQFHEYSNSTVSMMDEVYLSPSEPCPVKPQPLTLNPSSGT